MLENEIFFNEIVEINEKFQFSLTPPTSAAKWNDFFYNENNVLIILYYSDKNQLVFQSSKFSRGKK